MLSLVYTQTSVRKRISCFDFTICFKRQKHGMILNPPTPLANPKLMSPLIRLRMFYKKNVFVLLVIHMLKHMNRNIGELCTHAIPIYFKMRFFPALFVFDLNAPRNWWHGTFSYFFWQRPDFIFLLLIKKNSRTFIWWSPSSFLLTSANNMDMFGPGKLYVYVYCLALYWL